VAFLAGTFFAALSAGSFAAFAAFVVLLAGALAGTFAGTFAVFAAFFGAPRGRVESGGVTVAS
jgi:hypothetical protein